MRSSGPHATQTVDRRKARLRQIRTFGSQWQQMLAFHHQTGSHGLLAPSDHPMFILLAGDHKLPVEISDILCFRHRHPVIAPKVSGFSFNTALLMSLGRRAELRFEPPVRTESHEARRLFPT